MAQITVAHHDLSKLGGGEAICMTVLEALQEEHDVTLLTTSKIDDIGKYNQYFGTEVNDIDIELLDVFGVDLSRVMRGLSSLGRGKLRYLTSIAKHAVIHRYFQRSISEPDLFISTWDEVATDYPSIIYVHYPRRFKRLMPDEDIDSIYPVSWLVEKYRSAAREFANFDPLMVADKKILANSDRTALQVREWYGVKPQVLYPPVNTEGLSPSLQWEEREDGFILLSRIVPGKNIKQLIKILKGVHEKGSDIHFHIIGPRDNDEPEYYTEISSIVEGHDFVNLEGPMYGEELNKMLRQHKFGINGSQSEQFGLSIAEMVAAGMIPFVPDGGEQRKIVGENPMVIFNSEEDAVKKISRVVSTAVSPAEIKSEFPDIENQYGKEKFKSEIRMLVNEALLGDS